MRFLNRKLWPGAQPAAQGRLSRLVAQTAVDPDLRAREISGLPDATRRYAIFFVARSGSTWLADLLSRQLDLGKPREYLNINMVGRFAAEMNAGTLADYLALLRRKRATANGVFGIKVDVSQLSALIAGLPFTEAFHGHVWFYLRRSNFVAQAISHYKAMASGLPPSPPQRPAGRTSTSRARTRAYPLRRRRHRPLSQRHRRSGEAR